MVFRELYRTKKQIINRDLPILGANLIGEGNQSTITFDNYIPPLRIEDFDLLDEGVSIEKIVDNVVHFNVENPKEKYNISYSDALSRSKDFVLGLEDYFKFTFDYNEQSKEILLNISGGKPPYFIQLNSSNYSKQLPFGNGPKNTINLNDLSDLPDDDIQVYITDVEKLVEKFAGEIKSKSKGSSFDSIILLSALIGFMLVTSFMFIQYKKHRKKQEAWENLGEEV